MSQAISRSRLLLDVQISSLLLDLLMQNTEGLLIGTLAITKTSDGDEIR